MAMTADEVRRAEQAEEARQREFMVKKRIEILEGVATRVVAEAHPTLAEATKRDLQDAGYVVIARGDRAYLRPTDRVPALEREQETERFYQEMVESNANAANPRVATEGDLVRHAEKQGVSYLDAWNYFRDLGFDMTKVSNGA